MNTALFVEATLETLVMVGASSLIAFLLGLPLGILLFYTQAEHPLANASIYRLLNALVNVGRSLPFIILLIALLPFTRWLVGSSIGTLAAIVPLSVAAIPFYARLAQTALLELPSGLLELAFTLNASPLQTLRYILLPEARPSLIAGFTLTLINCVGYSAMAGAVGGGGLGSLAIHYGYQRFDVSVMIGTVVILIVLVQLLQWLGDKAALHFSQRI